MIRPIFLLLVVATATQLRAQDNYEIQVYGVDTVEPRSTMVEIHSNFTVEGSKKAQTGKGRSLLWACLTG